jgi:hypothetical protein
MDLVNHCRGDRPVAPTSLGNHYLTHGTTLSLMSFRGVKRRGIPMKVLLNSLHHRDSSRRELVLPIPSLPRRACRRLTFLMMWTPRVDFSLNNAHQSIVRINIPNRIRWACFKMGLLRSRLNLDEVEDPIPL